MSSLKRLSLASIIAMTVFGYSAQAAVTTPEPQAMTPQSIQQFYGWHMRDDVSIDWRGLGIHAVRGYLRYQMG